MTMIALRRIWAGRLAVLAALFLALSLGLSACAKNPVTGEDELVLMSQRQELQMGAKYYPQVIQLNHGTPPQDPELQSYVTRVGLRMARISQRPNLPWQFAVVNSSQANAFALPGGKICITRGLITKMNNEDELAGVLGHEIGHVTARHAVAGYTRKILISGALLGLGLALGDNEFAPVVLAAAGVAGGLMMLSYSRDQERQADELGFQYMTTAGYNPMAMVNTFELFKKMQKSEPSEIQAWLSSHPLPRERITAARKRALASPLSSRPFRTAEFDHSLARQKRLAPAYAAMERGNALARKKQWSQAAQEYQRAISIFPGEGLFHSRLALARMRQGRTGQAIQEARQGVRLSNSAFYPLFIQGLTELKSNNYRAAAQAYEQASRLMPDHVINNFFLAYSYDKAGYQQDAIRAYRRAYKASPRSKFGKAAKQRIYQLGGTP